MKLVRYRTSSTQPRSGAVLPSGHIADLAAVGGEAGLAIDGVRSVLGLDKAARRPLEERLDQVAADPGPGVEAGWVVAEQDVELLPPTRSRPLIVSCSGIFLSHLREMGMPAVANAHTDGFIVNPNIVIGSGQPIVLPELAPDMVDFEGELCVVFAKPTYRVSAEHAVDHVAGYTIHNDVSARDQNGGLTSPDAAERVASLAGIIRHKGFATFAPLGPCVTTRDELPDIESSRLVTTVNGEVMQDDVIGNLAMSIAEVIERVTRFHAFDVGDVMTLGTPAGVGYARDPQVFLRPGDVVEVRVDGIGSLCSPVCSEREASKAGRAEVQSERHPRL